MSIEALTPHEAALEMLGHGQTVLSDVRAAHDRLCELLERAQEPGRLTAVTLSTGRLSRTFTDPVDSPSRSVGLLNPTGLTVYLGVAGSATAGGEAIPVPPKAGLVLPVAANELDVGVDPTDTDSMTALGTSTAVVFLIRFESVQPFSFGAWAG